MNLIYSVPPGYIRIGAGIPGESIMKINMLIMAAGCTVAVLGCNKSSDHDRRAELASANGLMPGPAPTYEEIYIVDQAQVKTAPKRTVSYEPLESAAGDGGKKSAPAETAEEEAPKTKKPTAKPAAPKPEKTAAPKAAEPKSAAPAKTPAAPAKTPAKSPSGSGGSFWKNVGAKALTGGGPPPGAGKAPPTQTGKEKPKAAKSDDDSKDKEDAAEESDEDAGDDEKDADEKEEDDDSGKDDKKDDDGG